MNQDVQLLEVRVKQDEADLKDIYSKYRLAMDELARLRALCSSLNTKAAPLPHHLVGCG